MNVSVIKTIKAVFAIAGKITKNIAPQEYMLFHYGFWKKSGKTGPHHIQTGLNKFSAWQAVGQADDERLLGSNYRRKERIWQAGRDAFAASHPVAECVTVGCD
jgi:hypothetical protein